LNFPWQKIVVAVKKPFLAKNLKRIERPELKTQNSNDYQQNLQSP